jgi:hypothetical protein
MKEARVYYKCLIEERDPAAPFIQAYWANGAHVGEAIDSIVDVARKNGCKDPIATEIESFDVEDLTCAVEPNSGADVFWSLEKHYFEGAPTFEIPRGVIPCGIEGEHDVDEIATAYSVWKDQSGFYYIDVIVESVALFETFGRLLRLQSAYKVFWYVIHGHWDEESEDAFLVSEEMNTAAAILEHLGSNYESSVENGYVTLTAFFEEGATNLKITDHKYISIITTSEFISKKYERELRIIGFKKKRKLVTIEHGIHHYHYRPARSRNRDELIAYIRRIGFKDWVPGESKG